MWKYEIWCASENYRTRFCGNDLKDLIGLAKSLSFTRCKLYEVREVNR